jgi:hypothetical protein
MKDAAEHEYVCGRERVRLFPNARNALAIVQPKTVVRWHRAGFRSYWRWKSRRRAGRPVVSIDLLSPLTITAKLQQNFWRMVSLVRS